MTMKKSMLTLLLCTMWWSVAEAQDNTIRDGGEYYIYNTFYNKALGANETNDSPALSQFIESQKDSYIFIAEKSSLHEGYYWLKHKTSNRYLQASNKQGDTWSVWFSGSLNKEYNSYEWKITSGTKGEIISNRGEAINTSGNYWLGPDKDKNNDKYIFIYYDKPQSERTIWQIVDANYPLETSRLKLYTDELNKIISEAENVYENPVFGTKEEKYELAVALYNARSACQNASLSETETMNTASSALIAAINNIKEQNYTTWISGNSFQMGTNYTLSVKQLSIEKDKSIMMLFRNSKKQGIIYNITGDGQKHNYHFSINESKARIYIEEQFLEEIPVTDISPITSVGTSAEWSIIGNKNLISYIPEIISSNTALEPGNNFINDYGKTEVTALMVHNAQISLDEAIDYHVLSSTPLENEEIIINNEDAWIIFDNIRPSEVKGYKDFRKAIYLHGCAIYKPQVIAMYGYKGTMYSEDQYTFSIGKTTTGEWLNEIQSFVLKRGYMACLATQPDGGGYSMIYVADHEDETIPLLPELLNQRISYINIRPWNWVSKKGWCSTESTNAINEESKQIGATWFYTWGADRSTQTDQEYVPQKSHIYWPSWEEINKQSNATAVMGYNEPDHSEQHSDDCGKTIDAWTACTHTPEFHECGLRIGSPSPTDAGWLKNYIGHCNDMAYRVDFVTFHSYWGTNEAPDAASWKSKLQKIYNDTKRPIWLNEWNNGASWTTEDWPSDSNDKYAKQKNAIINILKVLDECDFIERYSIYNWDSWFRAVMSWDNNKNSWWITPCGEVYRDSHPTHAYNKKMQFTPIGWFPKLREYNKFSFTLKTLGTKITTSIINKNGNFSKTEDIEYLTSEGEWKHFYTIPTRSQLNNTNERIESYSCKDCVLDAFMNDSLTLRLKISTLNGQITVTDSHTQPIPAALRLIVGVTSNKQNNPYDEQAQPYDMNGTRTSNRSKKIIIQGGIKKLSTNYK